LTTSIKLSPQLLNPIKAAVNSAGQAVPMYYHPGAQSMKLIPFFRAGRQLDSQGRSIDFSEAEPAGRF